MYGIPYAALKLSLSLQKQIGVFLNCLFFFAVHSIGHGDPKSVWGDNFPFLETTSLLLKFFLKHSQARTRTHRGRRLDALLRQIAIEFAKFKAELRNRPDAKR